MPKVEVLLKKEGRISERYYVACAVFKVDRSLKFPDGIKARFALIDVVEKSPRLIIDNHEPYGFHVHIGLPSRHDFRHMLQVRDYMDALTEFERRALEIVNENS